MNTELQKNGRVAILTIRTPGKINQFGLNMLAELSAIFDKIHQDSSISVLIITGRDKVFVAGGDIQEMVPMDSQAGQAISAKGQSVYTQVENLNCITIAAINGAAVGGGCELALACDYRIAVESAKIGLPEINIGILPGWGGCYRLPRLIGYPMARDIIFHGKIITAAEAKEINLVDQVVSTDELMQAAEALASPLLEKSPLALTYTKQALRAGITADQSTAHQIEQDLFGKLFDSHDKQEGMRAFLEKRSPKFTGN